MPRLEHRIEQLEERTATSEEVFPLPSRDGGVVYVTKRQVRELLHYIAAHGTWIQVNPRWAQEGNANGVS